MSKESNYTALKKFSRDQGIDLFGVADISEIKKDFLLKEKLLKQVDTAVSLGIALSAGVLEDVEAAPTRLYFHHYKTVNMFLDQTALKLARYLQTKGYLAVPIPASIIVDWQSQKAHLSHKTIGHLAGLGWIGRNNLLVNKDLGSQFRLATILTDMPLKVDRRQRFSCGTCLLCKTACPAGAIHDDPAHFDHQRCFAQLKEFQKQRLVDQYICGVCVHTCVGLKKS